MPVALCVPCLASVAAAPLAAVPAVAAIAVGALAGDRAIDRQRSQALIGRIAEVRVMGLLEEDAHHGPVSVASLAGWVFGGKVGSLVAGFATSVGCAAMRRRLRERAR